MSYSVYVTGQDDFRAAFCAAIEQAGTIEQVMHISRMNAEDIKTMDAQTATMMRTAVLNRLHFLGYKR
jgi:hypothetical protein